MLTAAHGPPAEKKQAAVTTGTATNRPSLRDGVNAYSAISPVSGLLATVARPPRQRPGLDASFGAPGPRDFTSGRQRSSTLMRTLPSRPSPPALHVS
ncbi:MAG: hypothetical protein EKK32_27515 [Bradyrhizobiaceae bacterium]|nr:hypothetical protein BBta_6330 [Bradyrhizobium sp. BTAi1]RTL94223.1 MAG: hypothetical protein EKK32_27515 [Bradyrhizobiaceae bacterium]